MHMAMVTGAGIVLLGLFLLFGKLWGGAQPEYALAAKYFIPVWCAVALANMWIGVTRAGYTVAQELPILFIVAAIPVAVALLAVWQLGRS